MTFEEHYRESNKWDGVAYYTSRKATMVKDIKPINVVTYDYPMPTVTLMILIGAVIQSCMELHKVLTEK